MTDVVRPLADPAVFAPALPQTDKPFTGSPEIVDDLIVRVMGAAHQFKINAREGMSPDENMAGLRAAIDGVRDILAGKVDDFETLSWQSNGGLADHLRDRFGMDPAEPDPVGGYLTRLALNVVRLYKDWQSNVVNDVQAQAQLEGLKTEAARDLLGLPDNRGDDG